MASSNQNIEIGAKDSESSVAGKLAAFVDGLSYPFQVNIVNKGARRIVLPYLHGEVIEPGATSPATINEPWQINDLFFNGLTFSRLHGSDTALSVSLVVVASKKGDE